MDKQERTPKIACDFDGVINSYVSGWTGAEITDPPVDGAVEWLEEISKSCRVVIFSARLRDSDNLPHVKKYLLDNGLSKEALARLRFEAKISATVYLDDRAIQFDGKNFPTAAEVRDFTPWNEVTEVLEEEDFFGDLRDVFGSEKDGGFW